VITATHRQDRTFFPPKDYCPCQHALKTEPSKAPEIGPEPFST
jgi:hypothetical protein